MSGRFYLVLFFVSLLFSLFLYQSSLDFFFFQDDFFEINISKAQNLKEYLEFFKFRDDIIAYRPISLQNYFFVSNNLFKLNPIGFRTITYLAFIISSALIVKVITEITKNSKVGLLTASIWLLSAIHFMSLTWIAAAYNIIGTFFFLLTSLCFLSFLKTKKFILYPLSLFLFIITIGSFEFSLTWPIIFGFYYFYVLKYPLSKTLKVFFPFLVVASVYLILRLVLIKIPQITEYKTMFNVDSLKALFWYVLWTFNIPEEFKKQILNNLLIFNPKFTREYWPLIFKTFLGAFLVLVVGVVIPLFKIIKNQKFTHFPVLVFGSVWFVVGIAPVLILPNHTFSMYLTLSSIGIYLIVAYLLVNFGSAIKVIILLLVWFLTTYTTLSFYKLNSWMVEAQRFSLEFSQDIAEQLPVLPQDSIIYFYHPDTRHHQALLGSHAVRTIYQDLSLSIYYNKKSLLEAVSANYGKPVYIYSQSD